MLHNNPVTARSGFVRKTLTASLNKRLRLGEFGLFRRWSLAGLVLASSNLVVSTSFAQTETFTPGYWVSAGHEIVLQIAPCGGDLCGFIAGIALDPPTDAMPKDWRGNSQCGFLMLRVSPIQPGRRGQMHWNGTLQDPRNGNVYRTLIKFDSNNNLDLRGYIAVPLLGETQVWPPYHGPVLSGCRVPELDGTHGK